MQPTPLPKKKSGKGLLITAIVLAVLGFASIGTALAPHSGATTTSGAVTTSTIGRNNTATVSSPSSSNTVAHVGQTISLQSVSCTLISAQKLFTGQYDVAPKAGHEYIYVHITLKNTGDSEQTYNSFDFHVKSGSGDITDEEIFAPASYTQNNRLNSGTLAAGGTTSGDIIFQVSLGDHAAQFTWKPTIFDNSTQYAWSLGM